MIRDLRLAIRGIRQSPSYAAMVIGSLAIGIAAPTLAFALINTALLRGVNGVSDITGLISISVRPEGIGRGRTTWDDYVALKDRVSELATLAAHTSATFTLARDGADAITLSGELVSGNYFDVLRLQPTLGTFFQSDGDMPPTRVPAIVIGSNTWHRYFQADDQVIGRVVLLNGVPLQIAAVAPEGFHGVTGPENMVDLWVPAGFSELALRREGRPASVQDANGAWMYYVGRLRSAARPEQVQAAITGWVPSTTTDSYRPKAFVWSLTSVAPVAGIWRVSAVIVSIMALPLLVLAIACVNAGNLVLARATRASAAWSAQLALGANRWQLVRQPLIEGVVLALPAAGAGLWLTATVFPYMRDMIRLDVVIDWRVVAFTLAIAVITPIAFGVGPSISVISRVLTRRPGSPVSPAALSRLRTALVVTQIALSLALLGTGTQFARTLRAGMGDGFTRADATLIASFDVDPLAFSRDSADSFSAALLQRVRTIPGAANAAVVAGPTSWVAFHAKVKPVCGCRTWRPATTSAASLRT